eukprot:1162068-Pelagomonas_calceolata.AAC.4
MACNRCSCELDFIVYRRVAGCKAHALCMEHAEPYVQWNDCRCIVQASVGVPECNGLYSAVCNVLLNAVLYSGLHGAMCSTVLYTLNSRYINAVRCIALLSAVYIALYCAVHYSGLNGAM